MLHCVNGSTIKWWCCYSTTSRLSLILWLLEEESTRTMFIPKRKRRELQRSWTPNASGLKTYFWKAWLVEFQLFFSSQRSVLTQSLIYFLFLPIIYCKQFYHWYNFLSNEHYSHCLYFLTWEFIWWWTYNPYLLIIK